MFVQDLYHKTDMTKAKETGILYDIFSSIANNTKVTMMKLYGTHPTVRRL